MIRPATPEDVPVIVDFIRELADYEKAVEKAIATVDQLHAALFSSQPAGWWAWVSRQLTVLSARNRAVCTVRRNAPYSLIAAPSALCRLLEEHSFPTTSEAVAGRG